MQIYFFHIENAIFPYYYNENVNQLRVFDMANYDIMKSKNANKNLDVYIGNRVKFRRTMLGISQDKLGTSLGITFQQIQKYEKGVNRISASTLYSIANVLGVDFSYFVEGYDNSSELHDDNSPTYEADNTKKKETSELLRAYYKISDSGLRKKILDFVKGLSSSVKKMEEKE